jgi:putative ABC transport system permease protein
MVAGVPEQVSGARVSPEFFPATKAMPLLGRSFAQADWQPFASAVVIISHGYWTERFAASPEIIGRTIDIDGAPSIVVGVMPQGFDTPPGAKIWRPRVAR